MQYILILGWLGFTAVLGQTDDMYHRERVLGRVQRRATWTYALFVMIPIVAMAVMRSNYFGDTFQYIQDYRSIPAAWSGKLNYIRSHTKDTGFYALGALVSVFAGLHFRYFFLIVAVIQGFCLTRLYRKFSVDFWFAVFVFVATTDYYSWMFNGIRQFVAVAITLLAFEPTVRKKYIEAVLMIVAASLFHKSALLMLPVIFIVQGSPWNWKTLVVMLGTALVMSFSGAFTDALDTALQDTQYSAMVSDWTQWQDDGTNPLRVLVYSVPAILSLPCRKQIMKSGDRAVLVACNMSIMAMALYLVSMVTSGLFMGRLPIYCSLYANGILLPWELKHVYGRSMRLVALCAYVFFYFFQMIFAWGII